MACQPVAQQVPTPRKVEWPSPPVVDYGASPSANLEMVRSNEQWIICDVEIYRGSEAGPITAVANFVVDGVMVDTNSLTLDMAARESAIVTILSDYDTPYHTCWVDYVL